MTFTHPSAGKAYPVPSVVAGIRRSADVPGRKRNREDQSRGLQFCCLSCARGSRSGRLHQRPENRLRNPIGFCAAFRVPLHRQHKMIRGGSLQGFDHIVQRGAGRHSQALSGLLGGLMVTGVDLNHNSAFIGGRSGGGNDRGQFRGRINDYLVGPDHCEPRLVIHQRSFLGGKRVVEMLHQGARAVHV